jgi:hypothetical protein
MKKKFLLLALIIAVTQLAKAQVNTVAGSVKDEKGNPLHFVFVGDSQYRNATFSDSLGNFIIAVHPDSKLQFQLAGHKDATASAEKASLQVVLESTGASTAPGTISTSTEGEKPMDLSTMGSGGVTAPGHKKGNLHGNRYITDDFVHGFLINSSDVLVHGPTYMMDYDKTTGAVLLTEDGKNINQLSYDKTKTFTLFTNKDETFVFETAPAIDNAHYLQVLSSGKKYKILKLIKTRFVKSDYVNTGVTSHGNDYDEYVDDADYYVVDLSANKPQKISLKKKSIKDGFAKEADKVNKYLSDNSGSINDAYLGKLGAYMNQ